MTAHEFVRAYHRKLHPRCHWSAVDRNRLRWMFHRAYKPARRVRW